VGKDRAPGTYNKLCVVRKHLANFIKSHYKRKDIAMKELTEDFIRQFDIYLRTQVGLASSTIWMYTIPVKSTVTRAHCNGQLHRNPFAQYHISPNVKERQFLTEEELQRVISIELEDRAAARVRDIFVFCCLTGISYVDTKNLTTDNLENINGGWWIVSKRQKTKVPFRVKLLDSAYRIIERHEPTRKGNRLFRLYSNTYANTLLRKVAKDCGIEKPISWHSSRHSFATLAMGKGMPIESVSKILGHTNITTTQIYAKITTEKLERDMSAFGEKLEAGFAARANAPRIIPMPTVSARSKSVAVN
jgi:integrase